MGDGRDGRRLVVVDGCLGVDTVDTVDSGLRITRDDQLDSGAKLPVVAALRGPQGWLHGPMGGPR